MMGTNIRPSLSEKNKYWIDKHRYYELKHFCLQYPLWQQSLSDLTYDRGRSTYLVKVFETRTYGDPVAASAMARAFYQERIDMIDELVKSAGGALAEYIHHGVTKGLSYDILKARLNIPCGKDLYYETYRRFFWMLDQARN